MDTLTDIFGSCIETLLMELPDTVGSSIVSSLMPSIRNVVSNKKSTPRSLEASLSVLHALLARQFLIDNAVSLTSDMLALLSSSPAVVKRALASLGALVGYLTDEELGELLIDKTSSLSDFNWVQFIYSATRSASCNRLKRWTESVVLNRFYEILTNSKYFESSDFENRHDHVIEMIVHSLENIFTLDWIELYIPKLTIMGFVAILNELETFNPNRFDNSLEEEEDDEDTSWKIRFAVKKLRKNLAQLKKCFSPWDQEREYLVSDFFSIQDIVLEGSVANTGIDKLVVETDLKRIENELNSLEIMARSSCFSHTDILTIVSFCGEKLIPKNAALVREIDLGAFKHREDEGEGVRRSAIQLIHSLASMLRTDKREVDPEMKNAILSGFLKCCIAGKNSEILALVVDLNLYFVYNNLSAIIGIPEFSHLVELVKKREAEREGKMLVE